MEFGVLLLLPQSSLKDKRLMQTVLTMSVNLHDEVYTVLWFSDDVVINYSEF